MRRLQLSISAGAILLSMVFLPGCSPKNPQDSSQISAQPGAQGTQASQAGSPDAQAQGGVQDAGTSTSDTIERPSRGSLFNRLQAEQTQAANAVPNQQEGDMTSSVTTQTGLKYEELSVGNGPSPQ